MVSEKKTKAHQSFESLWKVNEPDWVKERKIQFSELKKGPLGRGEASYVKAIATFFVYGRREEYINSRTIYAMTPITSPSIAKEVFYSDIFDPKERRDIFSLYIGSISTNMVNMSWQKEHCQSFINGVMGSKYRLIEELLPDGDSCVISVNPASFCASYLTQLKRILNQKLSVNYHGYMDCFDYFLSCIEAADRMGENFESIDLTEYFGLVDMVLAHDGVTPYSREVASFLKISEEKIFDLWLASK